MTNLSTTSKAIAPTFICIGPGRAGTSWLYEILLDHPQIGMAKNIKETEFFDLNFDKGADWYYSYFTNLEHCKAVGEITNRYIFNKDVAGRIKATLGTCKIMVCLRNPYDRIISNYGFKIREGALNCSFDEAIEIMPDLVSENLYSVYLESFLKEFPLEDFFFFFYDDLINCPENLCSNTYRFLGVDPLHTPQSRNKIINQSIKPRWSQIAKIAKLTARLLRKAGLHSVLTAAKRSDTLKSIFFKPYNYQDDIEINLSKLDIIKSNFNSEIEKLSLITKRDLSHWLR